MLNPNFKYSNIHDLPINTEFVFNTWTDVVSIKFTNVRYGGSSGGTSKQKMLITNKDDKFFMQGIILKKNKKTTVIGLSSTKTYKIFDNKTKTFKDISGILEYFYTISSNEELIVGLATYDVIKNNNFI